jgi:hypothetical protein
MSFSDNIKVMTINYASIKDCDILAFDEIPEEQTKVLRERPESEEAFLERFQKIIQLALIDPARWSEFEELSMDDFFTFFWKWVQASSIIDEEDVEHGTI